MKHNWNYESVGGNTRVKISTAEDIRHLGELDEKMWTVLSCPTTGLEIPAEDLNLMDFDGDGKIRVHEVVKTSEWLCSVLANPAVLLDENDTLRLEDLNAENAEGAQMLEVAKAIAGDKNEVCLACVEAAMAAAAPATKAVEAKPVPAAPFDAAIMAAVAENKEAYNAYFTTLRLEKLGLKKADPELAPGIKEKDWDEMTAKIAAYEAEKGAIEAENAAAQAAVDAENAAALAAATDQFKPLLKLLRLKRSFFTLLKNFVTLHDFYRRDKKAIFQCGTLIIDQRACELCVRVADAGAMGAQAAASSMYLLFCDCENKPTGKKMSIIAAMTAGDVKNLAVGKNAIFYDRAGLDYDARVTKILDNPISIRQAFWTPYKKFADWVGGLINKSVAEKEAKGFEDMKANATIATEQAKVNAAEGKPAPAPAFDIAKFAGIFAAFGMALGAIGTALVAVGRDFAAMAWWQVILVIIGILLVISGPSMLMAYFKLRRRNLAPVLNANGWAVNAEAIINVPFGNTLTDMAQFPLLKLQDPFAEKKMPAWKKCLITLAVLAVLAGGVVLGMYLTHRGPFAPAPVEEAVVEELAEEAVAEVAEVPAEEIAE